MFDPVGAFEKQFTSVNGGYLYYPSGKSGGKLITTEEYDELLSDWQRIAGSKGRWIMVGLMVGVLFLWTIISQAMNLAEWADSLVIAACVVCVSARVIWASLAPRRLVLGRPEITPSRPLAQARREARALLSWRFVLFAMFLSGLAFFGTLGSTERTLGWWAWVLGSGAIFAGYVWISLKKVIDRQS